MPLRLDPVLRSEEHSDCKVSKKSKYEQYAKIITDNLDPDDLQWFRGTQFGHVLDVASNFQHSGQLLWSLVLRMAAVDSENEFWMVVNCVPIRYTLKDFALLTGLCCGDEYPVVDEANEDDGDEEDEDDATPPFVHRHWPNNTEISIYDVIDKMEQNSEAVDHLEKRKMAALIFVVGVLMANDKNFMKIKAQFLTLIDNIDAFCAYPWGRESFKYSIKQLKKDIKSKCGSSNATFTFNGFIYPFEVFAYECIPAVANRLANPVSTEDPAPRMCCWKTIKWRGATNPSRVEINNLIERSQDIRSMLFATNEEMRTPWMVNYRPFVGRNADPIVSQLSEILDRGERVVFGHDHPDHVSPFVDQDAPSTSEHEDAPPRVVRLENEVQAIRKEQEAMRREMAVGFEQMKQHISDQFRHWSEMMLSRGHQEHHYNEGYDGFSTPQPHTTPLHEEGLPNISPSPRPCPRTTAQPHTTPLPEDASPAVSSPCTTAVPDICRTPSVPSSPRTAPSPPSPRPTHSTDIVVYDEEPQPLQIERPQRPRRIRTRSQYMRTPYTNPRRK